MCSGTERVTNQITNSEAEFMIKNRKISQNFLSVFNETSKKKMSIRQLYIRKSHTYCGTLNYPRVLDNSQFNPIRSARERHLQPQKSHQSS